MSGAAHRETTRKNKEDMASPQEGVEVVRGARPPPPSPEPREQGCSTVEIPPEFREEELEARLLDVLEPADGGPYDVSVFLF